MSIDEALRALCAKHDLTTISVHMSAQYGPWANAHWHGEGLTCSSGSGRTVADAIADAIANASTARTPPPEVPALEMDDAA
ncbi:hypothetical protein [Novosphingobium olei]|uniref:Uncharacterized protein n=1 Tax=Novosphingobium olei TaxID=2728851 RepID=A0A7Y0GA68_9SPHN|nr:hypothetical protein [Novosphingobium olei]NML93773.1 hypothetical protein [Novosphingobium olei]